MSTNNNPVYIPVTDPVYVPSTDSQIAQPAPTTPSDPGTATHCSYLMAILTALENSTNSEYAQEAADAKVLVLDQDYEADIAQNWTNIINSYMDTHDMSKIQYQEQVSQYQTQMSTYGNQADSVTHGMQTTTDTDTSNLSKIVDMFSSVTSITSFTANTLSH